MADQAPNKKAPKIPWFIEAGQFFLDENNVGKKWDEIWGYGQIAKFLRQYALDIDPSLEDADFKQIVDFLYRFFQENDFETSNIIPHTVRDELARAYEKAREEKQALFLKQRVEKAFEASSTIEIKRTINREIAGILAARQAAALAKAPFKESEITALSQQIAEQFQADPQTITFAEKVEQMEDSPAKTAKREELENKITEKYRETVRQITDQQNLTEEQAEYLTLHTPSPALLLKIAAIKQPQKLDQESIARETKEALPLSLSEEVRTTLAAEFAKEVLEKEEITQAIQRISSAPLTPEKEETITSLNLQLDQAWEKAIERTETALEEQGIKVPRQVLRENPPVEAFIDTFSTVKKTAQEIEQAATRVKSALEPMAKQEVEAISSIVGSVITSLPRVDFTPREYEALPETKRAEVAQEVRNKVEEAVFLGLAINYEDLTGRITLPAEKVEAVVNSFLPQTPEETKSYIRLISAPPEERPTTPAALDKTLSGIVKPILAETTRQTPEQKEALFFEAKQRIESLVPTTVDTKDIPAILEAVASKDEASLQKLVPALSQLPEDPIKTLSTALQPIREKQFPEQIKTLPLEQKEAFFAEAKQRIENLIPTTIKAKDVPAILEAVANNDEASLRKLVPALSELQERPVKVLSATLQPVWEKQFPGQKMTFEKFQSLSSEQKNQIFTSVSQQVKERLGVEISPLQSQGIVEAVLTNDPKKLEGVLPFSLPRLPALSQEGLVFSLQEANRLPPTAPSATTWAFLRTATPAEFSQLITEGVTLPGEIKTQLLQKGVTPELTPVVYNLLSERQSFLLTVKGISTQDLDNTIKELTKKGESQTSVAIKELQAAKASLQKFQEKGNFSQKQISEWQKQRIKDIRQGKSLPLSLPYSVSNIPIHVTSGIRKGFGLISQVNNLSKRIFGEKAVFLNPQRIAFVNKITSLRQNATQKAKDWFFKTGLGKSVKAGLEKTGQKSLQGLWGFSKKGIQQAVSKGVVKLLTKLGLQAVANTVAPVVGAIAAWVGEKLVKGVLSVFKKGWRSIMGGFGISSSILSGLSSGQDVKEDSDLKQMVLVVPLVFILIPTIIFLGIILKAQAFIKDVTSPFRKGEDFIALTKTATPNKFENSVSDPYRIKYTVSIYSKEKRLHEISVTEKVTLVDRGVSKTLDSNTDPRIYYLTPLPSSFPDIEPGNTYSFEYELQLNNKVTDVLLINEVRVRATVDGPGGVDLTKQTIVVATVVFGNPTSCFVFSGPWENKEINWELEAISQLSSKPTYTQALCQNPAQPIVLNRVKNNDWCTAPSNTPSTINLTNKCVGSSVALYALAHESGHIFARRHPSAYSEFVSKFSGNTSYRLEPYLCSYPLEKTIAEDFPETIAVYFTNLFDHNYKFRNCNNQPINLESQYPEHYNFIRPYIE